MDYAVEGLIQPQFLGYPVDLGCTYSH